MAEQRRQVYDGPTSPVRRPTARGYELGDVVSAMQKAIRRGDGVMAMYWAVEMWESGFVRYGWRRLLIISAEDCYGVITTEIEALYRAWEEIVKNKPGGGRVFLAKAALILSLAKKSRDTDHLLNLIRDPARVDPASIELELAEARKHMVDVPDEAFDCHTREGKRRGMTRKDFYVSEHEALQPRMPGLLDDTIDAVKADVPAPLRVAVNLKRKKGSRR